LTLGRIPLEISSFLVGAFVPGIVAVTLGRTRELLPGDQVAQSAAWAWCTIAFAVGQAIAGYGFAFIFALTGNGYPILFALGAVALLLALIIDVAAGFVCGARK